MNGGLYRPEFERDNCGFGLMAQMDGKPSHWLLKTSINALARLTHRGAVAADGKTGDGCGLLLKKPDSFLKAAASDLNFNLSELYAVGMVFLNTEKKRADAARKQLETELTKEGLIIAGWRVVPVDKEACGEEALKSLPQIEQIFVNAAEGMDSTTFERHLYIARRRYILLVVAQKKQLKTMMSSFTYQAFHHRLFRTKVWLCQSTCLFFIKI